MDLQTLRANLGLNQYIFVFEFLRQYAKIFSDCRKYWKEDNQGILAAADECEKKGLEIFSAECPIFRKVDVDAMRIICAYDFSAISVTKAVKLNVARVNEMLQSVPKEKQK